MDTFINIYSNTPGEIKKFLNLYYEDNLEPENDFHWQKKFHNPINMIELIGTYVDNSDNFDIRFWINLDSNIYININENNADQIIKYLIERYPN